MNEFSINWIFLVDTLNFSFWSDQELIELPANFKLPEVEKYTVIYKQISYTGYWAMCAAVNRALDVILANFLLYMVLLKINGINCI